MKFTKQEILDMIKDGSIVNLPEDIKDYIIKQINNEDYHGEGWVTSCSYEDWNSSSYC